MRIVDFHSHFFSRTFFDTLADLSPHKGTRAEKQAPVCERTGIELPSPETADHVERWMAELDRGGVEHLVSFASLAEEIPVLAEAGRLAGGRLTPMAVVDPTREGAAGRVETLLGEHGFRGILTFPAMHHYTLGDESVRDTLARVASARGVVYVHCGMLVVKLRDLFGLKRNYDMRYANPLDVLPAANAFPEVSFVIPHFGAGFLRETLMLGTQAENVYVDTSSSNSWTRTDPTGLELAEVFRRALDVFGHERILFGTDSGVFPAGWRHDRFAEQRDLLGGLGLDEAAQASIFATNAERLLARTRSGATMQ